MSVPGIPDIEYLFCDVFSGEILAMLPLTQVSFTLMLNDAGPMDATLNVEDPRVAATNWIEATAPNKTMVFVAINGALVWGGLVQSRKYSMASQTVKLGAAEFWCYSNQLLQAADYTSTWASTAAGVAQIAYQVLSDALSGSAYVIPLGLNAPAATPSAYWLTASYPISQQQSVNSIVTELSGMGYPVGFDFAQDLSLLDGLPYASLTLSYPRRGRPAGTTGLVIDISDAVDFEWDEDGTKQANQVVELSTGYGGIGAIVTWSPSFYESGYPLLQQAFDHMQISSTVSPDVTDLQGTPAMMTALANGDLAMYAYMPVAPQITVPLFGDFQLGSFIVGDDISVRMSGVNAALSGLLSAPGIAKNPRFPNGIDFYLRITQVDVTVADEGLSVMKLTLNMPPAQTPIEPPQ